MVPAPEFQHTKKERGINILSNSAATGHDAHYPVARLMRLWRKHNNSILLAIILMMALYTTLSLGKQFWRLLWDTVGFGAIDLMYRYHEVQNFFAGEKVYSPYPTASYAILWPVLGWTPEHLVRYIWAFFYAATFAWLLYLLARVSQADNRMEYAFIGMCLLSMNAAHATVGTGQLGLYIVAMLIAGITVIHNNKSGDLAGDIIGSLLFIAALAKPTISAPFFWIVLFSGRTLPAGFIVTGYCALYLFSASFQDAGLIELTKAWLDQGSGLAAHPDKGSLNLSYYLNIRQAINTGDLHSENIPHMNIRISLILLMLLGMWIYHYRRIDVWVLLGLTGIFARLWTYHHTYDDVVIVFTMIAVFRIAKDTDHSEIIKLVAGILLFATIIINFFPAYVLKSWQAPWPFIYIASHAVVWAGLVVFLLFIAHRKNKAIAEHHDG